jgi:hypothetical protein
LQLRVKELEWDGSWEDFKRFWSLPSLCLVLLSQASVAQHSFMGSASNVMVLTTAPASDAIPCSVTSQIQSASRQPAGVQIALLWDFFRR